jgi:hypothetical protein
MVHGSKGLVEPPSVVGYGFLGRFYQSVEWTDTDKLGAAEPQPNGKENSRRGAETQRKDAD